MPSPGHPAMIVGETVARLVEWPLRVAKCQPPPFIHHEPANCKRFKYLLHSTVAPPSTTITHNHNPHYKTTIHTAALTPIFIDLLSLLSPSTTVVHGIVIASLHIYRRSIKQASSLKMRSTFAPLALAALVAANPVPQGVTSAISPSSSPPAGCSTSYSGQFEIQVVNVTQSSKREVQKVSQDHLHIIP